MIQPNALYLTDCLELLARIETRQANIFYIDPPQSFPTANTQDVSDFRRHLEFMSKVIQQAQRILALNGNIFLHCGVQLGNTYRFLLDQVFLDNFVGEYIIPSEKPQRSDFTSANHKIILHYGKTKNYTLNPQFRALSESYQQRYNKADDNGRLFTRGDITTAFASGPIYSWKGFTPGTGRSWRYSLSEMERLEREGRLYYGTDGQSMPTLKLYLDEHKGAQIGSVWDDIPPVTITKKGQYGTSQSVELLRRIVLLGSNPGDVIVDPFCGSGMMLVAAQNTGRRWIASDNSDKAFTESIDNLSKNSSFIANVDYRTGGSAEIMQWPIKPTSYNRIALTVADINPLRSVMALIERGEGETVEFKVAAYWDVYNQEKNAKMTDNIVETVAGFLNSYQGGDLLVGVNDSGNIVGLEDDFVAANKKKKNRDGYELAIRDVINSSIGRDSIIYYSVSFHSVEGKDICRINVLPGSKPFFFRGDLFIRDGNRTVKLPTEDAFKYSAKRWS